MFQAGNPTSVVSGEPSPALTKASWSALDSLLLAPTGTPLLRR